MFHRATPLLTEYSMEIFSSREITKTFDNPLKCIIMYALMGREAEGVA